jgi:hypothetical protein
MEHYENNRHEYTGEVRALRQEKELRAGPSTGIPMLNWDSGLAGVKRPDVPNVSRYSAKESL